MTRKVSQALAWYACMLEFPPPEPPPAGSKTDSVSVLGEDGQETGQADGNVPTEMVQPDPELATRGIDQLPDDWPSHIPDSADMADEIKWIQANRMLVCTPAGVDLTRARSPWPSMVTGAWLRDSILFPAKWLDVCAKHSGSATSDDGVMGKERMATQEVRDLLEEMSQ
ncbi:MAG: hypothetical protein DWQ42_20745 [Planctomycetota bacterium]|nr:MAG: hypothetical protein DWQ42_20745 [Planctomycetota bacterium]REK49178.1 MAG: hypothetical protein DWQ46_01345 [Planctomycetota bacterium]